ncbi:MAG: toxin-antitoxin system HicB family antitoxin [Chloroflexi bacterium]|nr:toxin-antitoxin system HicB family antitoxin [Chloroflexota bacterium]
MGKRRPLSYYLKLQYGFRVRVPAEGGYFVDFPDLPGAMTDSDTIEGLPPMIEEVRTLWMETAYEHGRDIPLPTIWNYDEEYSGRFNLRLPPSLHQVLAEGAESEGVSLNQYVVALLSRGDAQARIEKRLSALEAAIAGTRAGSAMVAEEKAAYDARPRPTRSRKKASGKKTAGRRRTT